MKKKILVLPLVVIIILICSPSTVAFNYSDNINEGISVFFLTSLDVGESIEVNVTHSGSGNFTLFLFNQRPMISYVNFDKSLNREIFNVAINYSLEDNPYIYYNASESKIYYFQLILLDQGPDTYFLYSDKELTRYYLPIIPGYQVLLSISLIFLTSAFLVLKYKKNFHKT